MCVHSKRRRSVVVIAKGIRNSSTAGPGSTDLCDQRYESLPPAASITYKIKMNALLQGP